MLQWATEMEGRGGGIREKTGKRKKKKKEVEGGEA